MGLFDKIFGKEKATSEDVISAMIVTADEAMDNGDSARAVEIYKHILRLTPNGTAQYNLGSLYAQGKGINQDFKEAAYWFRQAEKGGDVQAGKLRLKCSLDYIHQNFSAKSPERLYVDMEQFVKYVMPETENMNTEVCRMLYSMASNYFNKHEYSEAAKLFRAAAEFGNDGYSQNYLGVLYNAGAGVEKNDLVSLYWFDKAVENGAADVAQKDREGILNAYKSSLTPSEFFDYMMRLSGWCTLGNENIPKDAEKAKFWRMMGEGVAK